MSASSSSPPPWWRVPFVWFVIAGPAIVVVAGIATAVIAISGADPEVRVATERHAAETPAVQGRNHAAGPR